MCFTKYLKAIALSLIVIVIMLYSFMYPNMSLSVNIAISSFVFLVGLFLFAIIADDSVYIAKVLVLIFTAKVLIGIIHYVIFVDPNFFGSNGSIYPYGVETDSIYHQLESIVSQKQISGLFYFDKETFYATHPEIWNIIGCFFGLTGLNALSIVPINSYFTTIASYSLFIIARDVYYICEEQLKLIWYLFLFYPFFWLSDTFHRDEIGLSLVIISVCLYLLTEQKSFAKILMFFVVCYTGYILRTVYPFLFALSIFIVYVTNRNSGSKLFLNLILVLVFCVPLFLNLINNSAEMSYYVQNNKIMTSTGIVSIPLRIFVGIIGPFPWSQFSNYIVNRIVSFQLNDYLLGTLHLSLLFLVFKNRKYYFSFENFREIEYFGVLLLIAALFTSVMEISYVTVGVIFLAISICNQSDIREFKSLYIWCFMILFLISSLSMFIGNFGISTMWR